MALLVLVDDSPTVLKVMSISLMGAGHRVLTAPSGVTGLEVIKREHPQLAILDIHLPDIGGFEMLRRMKADPELADIPVLFLTGQDDFSHMEQGLTAGAVGFLPKHSTSPKILIQKIRSILGP